MVRVTRVEHTMSKETTKGQLLQFVAMFAQKLPLEGERAELQKVLDDEKDPFWVNLTERFSKKVGEVVETAKNVFTDMIAAGNYDRVNPNITKARFPVPENLVLDSETKMFHFNRDISSDDAIAEMGKDWRPATFYELLDYGIKNPEEQRRYPIVALGSLAVVGGAPRVACLDGNVSERDLDLRGFALGWGRGSRFLAVRK